MILTSTVAASIVAGTMHAGIARLNFWQTADPASSSDLHTLTIFVGIAAISLLVLVLMVLGAAVAALIVANKVSAEAKAVRAQVMAKAMPLIDKGQGLVATAQTLVVDLTPEIKQITTTVRGIVVKSQALVTDLTPQITQITTKASEIASHIESIAGVAKDKAHEFSPTISSINGTVQEANETVRVVNQKAREQVERVNTLVTDALDATRHMGESFSGAVSKPVRDVAGIVDNAKNAVNSVIGGAKASVENIVRGTKDSVDSVGSGTKSFINNLVHGAKGVAASVFAGRATPKYRPRAPYVSDPAPVNPSTHSVSDERDVSAL